MSEDKVKQYNFDGQGYPIETKNGMYVLTRDYEKIVANLKAQLAEKDKEIHELEQLNNEISAEMFLAYQKSKGIHL